MYKVGDKVKIREGLVVGEAYGNLLFDDDMEQHCLSVATITFIDGEDYILDIDDGGWYWSDEMLEGLAEVDKEDCRPQSVDNGGSTSYYKLPQGAKDIQDLIEYKNMNFSVGNIFKSCYRLGNCDHSDRVRDLNKIIWFAERELELALREG
jgi:hypothetical protein